MYLLTRVFTDDELEWGSCNANRNLLFQSQSAGPTDSLLLPQSRFFRWHTTLVYRKHLSWNIIFFALFVPLFFSLFFFFLFFFFCFHSYTIFAAFLTLVYILESVSNHFMILLGMRLQLLKFFLRILQDSGDCLLDFFLRLKNWFL